ncbi:unnamed protein product [Rhizophagus irregularis]|nr:unnamed protein product [Rhizophagus irregularis]
MLNIKLRELVQNQYQKQDIFQREIVNQNESEDLGVDSSYEKYNELSPNNDSPIHPADDISLRDNESDNSEPSLDDSIYSADISLEDYDSEYLDITPDSSQNSNDDDDLEESQNSNDDNDDLEESLSDMSIDDDVIDDSNETVSELSESMILALRLLDLKCKHNFTNNAFTDILNLIGGGLGEGSTLYLAKQRPIIDELKVLQGVYSEESRHVYFPCSMPRTSDITDFDPKELPKRTEDNFLNDISKIINETNKKTKASVIKETAVEWSDWITVYSIPFLLNKLSAKYLKGWAKFVQAVQKCLQFTLTSNDLDKVQQLLLEFYKHYESDYYQKKEEKLSAMLMSFHYLLHVADSIKDCGPCWVSWQYPMERLCGMLLPLVHSKLHPYVNLANNVMLMEKINYLSYISASKHIIKNNSRKNWPQHKVFSLENYDEELYFPSVIYSLDRRNELQKLIHFYSAILEISKEEIVSSIDNKCIKYGRMRTKDGHYVGSSWIKRDKISRNNYCVAVIISEDKELFGEIIFYLVHKHLGESRMLAYIHWSNKIINDQLGIKYFQGKSSKYGFIDISDIDRCVGFIELNNKIYIFDKENQVVCN